MGLFHLPAQAVLEDVRIRIEPRAGVHHHRRPVAYQVAEWMRQGHVVQGRPRLDKSDTALDRPRRACREPTL